MIRHPAVAGYFYPADKKELEQQIRSFLPDREKSPAIAVIVPHAGYVYSGHVAGEVYASVALPDTFIILCPNHTGMGSDFDLSPDREWQTPLGLGHVDETLCKALLREFPHAQFDGRAHAREHSLEVQLPFLQVLKPDIHFVPICVRQHHYQYLEELGHAMAKVIQNAGKEVLIIASSDMNHYEDQRTTERKDQLALDQIEKLDPRGLYHAIQAHDITMCGYLPATATIIAAKDLGATSAKVLKHATSGDITGDYREVVGYAGVRIQ